MNLAVVSAIACCAMAANDAFATWLTIAESKGRAALAGHLDMAGDICRLALYSYAGEQLLSHGWRGWLALLPVLATSNITTRLSTRAAARRLEGEPS